MFTGFASENTPAIQVWDFFQTLASTSAPRIVSLADGCAPLQIFKLGGSYDPVNVYLPTCPIEGQVITILNISYSSAYPLLNIYSSDVSGSGTSLMLFSVGSGGSLTLVYSKQAISYGTADGVYRSGWITLNQVAQSATNYGAISIAGDSNRANNRFAFVGGGASNIAGGINSAVVGGLNNNVSGQYGSIFGGSSNTVTNSYGAVVGGANNQAGAPYGAILGGYGGSDRSVTGNIVFPASYIPVASNRGASQTALLILGTQTTDGTAAILRSDNGSPGQFNQVSLVQNSAYYFQGSVIAAITGGGNSSVWRFEGGIKRGTGSSVSFIGTPTVTLVAQDAGASTWAVSLGVNTSNNTLTVTVQGQAATTIRWVCRVETTETAY